MQLTDKNIEDFKKIYKEKFGKDLDKQTAFNKASELFNMVRVLSNADREEQSRRLRLKKEPAGFPFPPGKGYTCPICRNSIQGEETWYDRYGMKCLICQSALNAGIIPKFIFTNRGGWYSMYDLERKFGLKAALVRKLVREGKIKAVIIPCSDGKPYEYIFLKKDNPKLVKFDPNTTPSALRRIDRHQAELRENQLQEWLKKTTEPPQTSLSKTKAAR